MVRLADLPEWEREHLLEKGREAPRFTSRPWVRGAALAKRRVSSTTDRPLKESLMSDTKWLGTSYPPPESLPPERWEKLNLAREQYLEDYESMVRERAMRDHSAPKVGEPAPDFEIQRLTPGGKQTGEMLRLSSTRGKPVALLFGSYT